MGRHARWRCGRGMSAAPAVRCEAGRVRARIWQPRASRGAGLGNTGHGGAQGWGTRERGQGSHASLRAGDVRTVGRGLGQGNTGGRGVGGRRAGGAKQEQGGRDVEERSRGEVKRSGSGSGSGRGVAEVRGNQDRKV